MIFYYIIFGVDIYEKSIENKKCYLWNEEIELWNFYFCILVRERKRYMFGIGIRDFGIDLGIVNMFVYVKGKGIVVCELFVVVL